MLAPAAGRAHTDGVEAALTAAGLLVGRGVIPSGGGWQGEPGQSSFVGYVTLYPFPGQSQGPELGTVGEPHAGLLYTVQGTCVGATGPQAEWVQDTFLKALVGVRVAVTGRVSHPAFSLLERPISRDDDAAPPVHFGVAQIRFRTDPAPA